MYREGRRYLFEEITPDMGEQLSITPFKSMGLFVVKEFHGFPVNVVLFQFVGVHKSQWEALNHFTLRDLMPLIPYSPFNAFSPQLKQVSEVALQLNFTPVEIQHSGLADGRALINLDRSVKEYFSHLELSTPRSLHVTFIYCTDKDMTNTNLLGVFNPFNKQLFAYLAALFVTLSCFVAFAKKLAPSTALLTVLAPLLFQNPPE